MSGITAAGGVTSLNGQKGAVVSTDYGAIGSCVLAAKSNSGLVATVAGETIAASSLRVSIVNTGIYVPLREADALVATPSLSGTWRALNSCGSGGQIMSDSSFYMQTLWTRIS